MTHAGVSRGDQAILDVLAGGPLSSAEAATRIRDRVRAEWSERHGYDFEWETDEEPVGARILAHGDARDKGFVLLTHEVHPRMVSLERRGLVERIQIPGHRPMLWRLA